MMVIENKFEIGEFVYLVTDADQSKRQVTGIFIRPAQLLYELTMGSTASTHYDFEISAEKDLANAI